MGHPSPKTLQGLLELVPTGRLEVATPPRHRGSAASKPRPAARCSPVSRSSTDSRCSSCRCCIRNSCSPCYTTAVMPTRTVADNRSGILDRRGIQKHQDILTVVAGLCRTIRKTRRPPSRPEGHLPLILVTHSLRPFHRRPTPTTPNRALHLQSPSHPNHRRTPVLPKPKGPPTPLHPRQRMRTLYFCRYHISLCCGQSAVLYPFGFGHCDLSDSKEQMIINKYVYTLMMTLVGWK